MGGRGAGSGSITKLDRQKFGSEFHIHGGPMNGTYVVTTRGKFRGRVTKFDDRRGFLPFGTLSDVKRYLEGFKKRGIEGTVEKLERW